MGRRSDLFQKTLFFHRFIARRFGCEIYLPLQKTTFGKLESINPRNAILELASREIYRYKVQGATAELGVYRGDFAKCINRFFPDRKLYLFDTFEGFDERDAKIERSENFSSATQDFSQTSEISVLNKMEHPKNCIIKKGWFPETREGFDEKEKFCFVSLDCDLYQPMLSGLRFFYPRLSYGGTIMIHDFNNLEYQGVRQAVKEFCTENKIGYVCISDECGSAVIAK